jgi:hypothetical protein
VKTFAPLGSAPVVVDKSQVLLLEVTLLDRLRVKFNRPIEITRFLRIYRSASIY